MLSLAALSINRIFGTVQKKPRETRREISGNQTATLRALSDLGESVASSVHAIYSPIRLYLCVAMEPKPDALSRQREADRKTAAGHFEVDANWSAAEVNARWSRHAVLTDAHGQVLESAIRGARGMTDAGAREVFFEFNARDVYPEPMYLAAGDARIRIK